MTMNRSAKNSIADQVRSRYFLPARRTTTTSVSFSDTKRVHRSRTREAIQLMFTSTNSTRSSRGIRFLWQRCSSTRNEKELHSSDHGYEHIKGSLSQRCELGKDIVKTQNDFFLYSKLKNKLENWIFPLVGHAFRASIY